MSICGIIIQHNQREIKRERVDAERKNVTERERERQAEKFN